MTVLLDTLDVASVLELPGMLLVSDTGDVVLVVIGLEMMLSSDLVAVAVSPVDVVLVVIGLKSLLPSDLVAVAVRLVESPSRSIVIIPL